MNRVFLQNSSLDFRPSKREKKLSALLSTSRTPTTSQQICTDKLKGLIDSIEPGPLKRSLEHIGLGELTKQSGTMKAQRFQLHVGSGDTSRKINGRVKFTSGMYSYPVCT